jgi:hypothetical protein
MQPRYQVKFIQNKKRERICIIIHRNGHVVLQSASGYRRLNKAVRSVKRFLNALAKGDYVFDVERVPLGRPVGTKKKR